MPKVVDGVYVEVISDTGKQLLNLIPFYGITISSSLEGIEMVYTLLSLVVLSALVIVLGLIKFKRDDIK